MAVPSFIDSPTINTDETPLQTSVSFPYTTPAGPDRLLTVCVYLYSPLTGATTVFVSYGARDFAAESINPKIRALSPSFVSPVVQISTWTLLAPATGVGTITVGFSDEATSSIVAVMTARDVNQVYPTGAITQRSNHTGNGSMGMTMAPLYADSRFLATVGVAETGPDEVIPIFPPGVIEVFETLLPSSTLTGEAFAYTRLTDAQHNAVANVPSGSACGTILELVGTTADLPLDKDFQPYSLLMPFAAAPAARDWDPLHGSPQPFADFAAALAEGSWAIDWALHDSPLPFIGWVVGGVPIALEGTASLVISTAGVLNTAILLQGTAALAVAALGNLITEILLVGDSLLVVTPAGVLTTEIRLLGTAELVVVTQGDLTTGGPVTLRKIITVLQITRPDVSRG